MTHEVNALQETNGKLLLLLMIKFMF